ncbi:hypothetical protein [Petrachloros mirabilis]
MGIGAVIGTTPIDGLILLEKRSPRLMTLFNNSYRVSSKYLIRLILGLVFGFFVIFPSGSYGAESALTSGRIWEQVVIEAEALGLPAKFLKRVPSAFVRFEFDDLRAFAAEYHLGEHRMVLNRALSFNAAGGTLRSLHRLPHAQMETLYHEMFHAFMDYLVTMEGETPGDPFLTFAREQQRCRYNAVLINPVVQRKMETEERFLSERESWEALNEAWAVFVGWAVWNQLEVAKHSGNSILKPGKGRQVWLARLEAADRDGALRGYYEPEDSAERVITRKRVLAPGSRLSSDEMSFLMRDALGYPLDLVQEASAVIAHSHASEPILSTCKEFK